jgi:hypothetical protein
LAQQPGPDLSLHTIEPHIYVFGQNPGMGEEGFAQNHLNRLLTEQLSQRATWADGHCPSPLDGLQLGQDGIGRINLNFTPKILEATIRHIPEIQVDVHQLVVAVEQVYRASGLRCLSLEALKQIDDFSLTVTPVQNVSGLNHHQVATDPSIVDVDGSGQAERRPGCLQIAMEISDGDYAGRRRRFAGRIPGSLVVGDCAGSKE